MQCNDKIESPIENIKKQIRLKEQLISDYYNKINIYKKEINTLQKELLQICNHNWVIDREASYYDRTFRYCSICGCGT